MNNYDIALTADQSAREILSLRGFEQTKHCINTWWKANTLIILNLGDVYISTGDHKDNCKQIDLETLNLL